MSNVRKCIKEQSAAGMEAPGRRVGIEVDGETVRDLRICAACTNVGRFAMDYLNGGELGGGEQNTRPTFGDKCEVEITAARNMKRLLAAITAMDSVIAARRTVELASQPSTGQLAVTDMPNLSQYLNIEALAAMAGSQQPQPDQLQTL